MRMSKNTQPSQVKKQQHRYVAIGLCVVLGVGYVSYSFLTTHASTTATQKRERPIHVDLAHPTTHVDDVGVWQERTQNALAKTEKATADLQQQFQLLAQQKSEQAANHQSQTETLQALQAQINALQEKLNFIPTHPSTPEKASIQPTIPVEPTLHPLHGVSDDVLALSPLKNEVASPIIQPSKTPESYVPSGTFVRAVMLGGADASAGVTSQGNPTPVLFRLLDSGTLPNHRHSYLKDCVATAAAIGDISAERGLMRLERLSCVSPNRNEIIELPVEGTVFGPEGKNGVRGLPLWREGALLKRAFVAGTLSGFSQGIASQYTTTAISPTGAVNSINNSDIFKYGAAQGVSNAMEKIADYNIRRADQYHPVIQLSAGTVVDIVFLKGFYLDGQKHDNDKESILPPFESPTSRTPTMPAVSTPALNASAASPPLTTSQSTIPGASLPLTVTQINMLKAQTDQNVQFFK
jgi:conjugal transfer pilus assembly protein TraB